MTLTATAAKTFTSSEVCTLARMTYRQLDYAVRHGALHPSRARDPEPGWPDGGSGNYRTWTEPEAVKAVELARMLAEGIGWPKAAELLADGRTATLQVRPLPETLP
jgi:hypothetical protein